MEIIDVKLKFPNEFIKREITDYIVLHHPDWVMCTIEQIHNDHIKKGYNGIGYHAYIRKNGDVYQGRPFWAIGAQVARKNSISVGVCFEGDYNSVDKNMPYAQFNSGVEVLRYLQRLYPKAKIVRHDYFGGTSCPGKYFPHERLIESASYYENETLSKMAIDKLHSAGVINSPSYWYTNAKKGKLVSGEYIETVFANIIKKGVL
jgi:hypothetical protein